MNNNNFDKALDALLKNEGGYNNDPADLGGETYCGISRKFHPSWDGWDKIDNLKKQHPVIFSNNYIFHNKDGMKDMVYLFYKENYWNVSNLDNINSIEIAFKIFDMNVNLGVGRASEIVQTSINTISQSVEIKVDKIIGSKTTTLINDITRKEDIKNLFLKILTVEQGHLYIKSALNNPSQKKFIKGWINRLDMEIKLGFLLC